MKLGAYYWDGWYERLPAQTERLLMEFPNRMPVWGWLGDTAANMELQIDIAADAGLSFFAFDWYYAKDGEEIGMNGCIGRYLKSRNAGRMEQCLLVANHDPYRICRGDWERFCEIVMPCLMNEHALKAGGAPVIIIFSPFNLIEDLGGAGETRECIEYFKESAIKNGLPGVRVVAGLPGLPRDEDTDAISKDPQKWDEFCKKLEDSGYDAVSGYNYHRLYLKKGDLVNLIYPFEKLSADYEYAWDMLAEHSKLPQMLCVNGGWDCRPWEDGRLYKGSGTPPSCYSPDRTPATQYEHVKKAGNWIKSHEDKSLEGLSVIYAWNENGEGGYIEPTVGDGGYTLNAIGRAIRESDD